MSVWSPANSSIHWQARCLLLGGLLVACGHQDGLVGVEPLAQAGQGPGGAAGQRSAGFVEEFAADSGAWEAQNELPGSTTSVGQGNPAARDGYLAELRLPGHPEFTASQQVGAQFATQLALRERFHFGTYRTRLSFGGCGVREDAVMAFLGYFNDGQDHDGDGIVDDLEIDVQVTCSAPSRIYLTVFTDYEEQPQGTRLRKLSHVVDFASGDAFETPAADSSAYVAAGHDSTLAAPDLLTTDAFYELGFEWHTDSIRFFLAADGVERDLWTLTGAGRVPQLPVQILYNLWHPDTHWYPNEGAADFPAADVLMRVDWLSFEPE
jgi:hypothetical protein